MENEFNFTEQKYKNYIIEKLMYFKSNVPNAFWRNKNVKKKADYYINKMKSANGFDELRRLGYEANVFMREFYLKEFSKGVLDTVSSFLAEHIEFESTVTGILSIAGIIAGGVLSSGIALGCVLGGAGGAVYTIMWAKKYVESKKNISETCGNVEEENQKFEEYCQQKKQESKEQSQQSFDEVKKTMVAQAKDAINKQEVEQSRQAGEQLIKQFKANDPVENSGNKGEKTLQGEQTAERSIDQQLNEQFIKSEVNEQAEFNENKNNDIETLQNEQNVEELINLISEPSEFPSENFIGNQLGEKSNLESTEPSIEISSEYASGEFDESSSFESNIQLNESSAQSVELLKSSSEESYLQLNKKENEKLTDKSDKKSSVSPIELSKSSSDKFTLQLNDQLPKQEEAVNQSVEKSSENLDEFIDQILKESSEEENVRPLSKLAESKEVSQQNKSSVLQKTNNQEQKLTSAQEPQKE